MLAAASAGERNKEQFKAFPCSTYTPTLAYRDKVLMIMHTAQYNTCSRVPSKEAFAAIVFTQKKR